MAKYFMLVSHKNKFIFLKTEKTAGTTVDAYFQRYCMPESDYKKISSGEGFEIDEYVNEDYGIVGARGGNWREYYGHMPAFELKKKLGEEIWEDYFKFTIVRNPFDKVVSYFHWIEYIFNEMGVEKWGNRRKLHYVIWSMQVPRKGSTISRFKKWVRRENILDSYFSFYPGFVNDRNRYIIDGAECVDFFMRTEDLVESIKSVCERLDLDFNENKIPRAKSSARPDNINLSEYYDSKTENIVRKKYSYEINKFGYEI